MAEWKEYKIKDIVEEIDSHDFVLPVIQRRLVWNEEKMVLLFDSLLKKNAFGGIMVMEQIPHMPPLFALRNFLREFTADASLSRTRNQVSPLDRKAYFVIDGQQRMQTLYIGLKGSYETKILYFNLLSDGKEEFEFAFADDEKRLPKPEKDEWGKEKANLWYIVPTLYQKFYREHKNSMNVASKIIESRNISSVQEAECIRLNIHKFYEAIFMDECMGVAIVTRDGDLDETGNRQKMVDLFTRLNNGGTILQPYDLIASTLKGFDWRMEELLDRAAPYQDIGFGQNEFIKLLFILQDEPSKNLANIQEKDSKFALDNQERIFNTLDALRKFLYQAKLEDYYLAKIRRSALPLYLAAYHIYHRQSVATGRLANYFDNAVTGNPDFSSLKRWFYLSLLNGVFKGRGSGWVAEKTGLNKIWMVLRNRKDERFPVETIFKMYSEYGLRFSQDLTPARFPAWDDDFLFYIIYDSDWRVMQPDIDHIHPKSLLTARGVEYERIYCIENYQLISVGVNRGDKNDKPLATWVDIYIKEGKKFDATSEEEYRKKHLIPPREFWEFDQYTTFLEKRGELIIKRVNATIPAAQTPEILEPLPPVAPDQPTTISSAHEIKVALARQHNLVQEFQELHDTVCSIRMWPTYRERAVQYRVYGSRILLTIYMGNGGFWLRFHLENFPLFYKITLEEIASLFDNRNGELFLSKKDLPAFIDKLKSLGPLVKE